MKTKKGRPKHLTDTSGRGGCDFTTASKKEGSIQEVSSQEMASTAVKTTLTYPVIPPENSSEDTHLLSKPALSYIALIAKVILSSPFKKLNLASIYRAMEEQFPYLRSRGPGWRNSVRHNLSVNDCFVKVSRCEDGRGHYWGVPQAYLRDFQQGNFRLCKKARGRRCDKAARRLAWMETYLGRLYERRYLGWVEPQCHLQDPRRYQISSSDYTQPWSVNVGWVQSTRLRLPDSYSRATAVKGQGIQPVTSRPLHCWEMSDSVLTGMRESYDGRFMTPTVQGIWFPGCWCLSPVIKELIKPLPYRINF